MKTSQFIVRSSGTKRGGTSRRTQRGFGLIEVMIAIVVLSVGMFGIALAQMNALRSQRNAHMRAGAVQLASDMAERMRLNISAVATDSTTYSDPSTTTYNSLTASPVGTPSALSPFSNAAAQATHDLAVWRNEIAQRLGTDSATGVVRQVAGQPYSRNVVVMWREKQLTTELSTIVATNTRGNVCASSGGGALVCDPNCPSDGTVNSAPLNVRCVQIGIQP
ncbi:MAG: type IV pilus modification protein PilV [Gammaproteobacteria bacterium]|nr:type IV pilus modification protein PilV [Gammaproteobacteria bacterium]